jgi:hypothetical protein
VRVRYRCRVCLRDIPCSAAAFQIILLGSLVLVPCGACDCPVTLTVISIQHLLLN